MTTRRARLLERLGIEPRYLGYRDADRTQPYAHFMRDRTLPAPDAAVLAWSADPTPAAELPAFADLARDLGPEGYSPIELGHGRTARGHVWVAVRTVLPGNTAAMWDWWFAWHLVESARYKLWHPDAHAYAAPAEDRRRVPGLSHRQLYRGTTSYVDEYVGHQLEQLAITFRDPAVLGLRVPPDQTVVVGQVGSAVLPVRLGWLAHQVRPIAGGAEMRSRFYLNLPSLRRPDLRASLQGLARGVGPTLTQRLPFTNAFGRDLLEHCAREMHHLSSFLPALHAEFEHRF